MPVDPAIRAQSVWDEIEAVLEEERVRLQEEIGSYPTPIPACDAQFNHLLERRARLGHELAGVRDAARETRANPDADATAAIHDFLAASGCLPTAARRRIRRRLREE